MKADLATVNRRRIETRLDRMTSRYLCTGECVHYPETAEAWFAGSPYRVTITSDQCGLFGSALIEKAVAILRNRAGRA